MSKSQNDSTSIPIDETRLVGPNPGPSGGPDPRQRQQRDDSYAVGYNLSGK